MKKTTFPILVVLSVVAACGGDPFETGGDAGIDVELTGRSPIGSEPFGGTAPDAAQDAGADRNARDASTEKISPDASTIDSSTMDARVKDTAAPDVEVDGPLTCPVELGCALVNSPGFFCLNDYPEATPAACDNCAKYTCACVLAHYPDAGSCSCVFTSYYTLAVTCP